MRLLLIDGNNIMNRAFFAIPPLNDAEGRNVNAVYGFMGILFKAVNDYTPTHVAVAFDSPWPTKRHAVYADYKATRKTMDEGLRVQMSIVKELLNLMEIKNLAVEGIEADDIIGSVARLCGVNTLILSGDRDMWQLVSEKVTVIYPKRGVSEAEEITPAVMEAEYELLPSQIIDYKALCGDSSDNIHGVRGIGDKTAKALLKKYKTLNEVYENIAEISGKIKDNLLADKESAFLSRELVRLETDLNLGCCLRDCIFKSSFSAEALEFLKHLKFNTFIKKLEFTENNANTDKLEEVFIPVHEICPSNTEELYEAVKTLSKAKELVIITGAELLVAPSSSIQYRFTRNHENLGEEDKGKFDFGSLREIFECEAEKIVYDNKRLRHELSEYNISLNNMRYDLSIMYYLAKGHSAEGEREIFVEFASPEGAAAAYKIRDTLLHGLKKDGMEKLYGEVELPLSELLFEVEKNGVKIDLTALKELGERLCNERRELESDAFRLTGEKFNLNSSRQLSEVLYSRLNLPKGKKTKSGFSTDNDELMRLNDLHPVIPVILKHRQVNKLIGTYVEGMLPHVKNGTVHTTYNQTLTVTGRLSSSDPNLQNIPVRNNAGKEIRRMFIPKNDLLISADYSQIELRLLAELSEDNVLTEAFNSGKDIHNLVASEIFNLPAEMINDNMRRTAKAVNFGIIYGISDYGLSQNIGITQSRAKSYIKKYFERYPSIRAYLDKSISDTRKNKYITTISGRRRYIPEIASSTARIRAFGERAAMNMPLQGSAADIMKIAMIAVHKEFKFRGLKSYIILQVHDELIIDAFNDEKLQIYEILKEKMENAVRTRVKLTINITSGNNLMELK